jgi:HEAT repeat protein
LGLLGGPEAKASLLQVKKDEAELTRAAALMSLARLGEMPAVLDSASDRSWRVRLAVAQSLTACPNAGGQAAARKLLGDASSEVQRATVLAIAGWPLPQSGPLLMEALAANSYTTRRTAARELARLWPAAAGFPIDGPAERRATSVEQLARRFREEFGSEEIAAAVGPGGVAQASSLCPGNTGKMPVPLIVPLNNPGRTTTDTAVVEQTVARVDQCLGRLIDAGIPPTDRQAAIESLLAVGPALVPVLEQLAAGRQFPLPEAVYHEVLPRQNPVYAALDRLASGSLTEKRRAADELADFARHKPLGRLATERLAAVTVKQQDALVWQGVLAAVQSDVSPGAVDLAYAAIGHPAPEVRRRACQYLASHPDPRHVAVLLPALGDSNGQVVTVALRAIGAGGKLDDPQPVRRLLTAGDETQRLEAAGALARLGDSSGLAALERLTYADNPSARQRTAELMGELGNEACLASLIRLLDDNWQSVRLAALKSLPKVAGQDVARTEGEWSVTAAQRITLWKQWYQEKGGVANVGGHGLDTDQTRKVQE